MKFCNLNKSLIILYGIIDQGDIVIHVTELSFEAVFTRVLHAIKLRVGSIGIFVQNVNSSHHSTPIPIFEGPPSNRPDPEGNVYCLLPYLR